MNDFPYIIELVKYVGFPVVIFAVWYFYHKSEAQSWRQDRENDQKRWETDRLDEMNRWKQIFDQQEKHSQRQFELFQNTVNSSTEAQKEESARQFSLLKDLTETVQYHAAILARMENKIDSNQYCPYTREIIKGGK